MLVLGIETATLVAGVALYGKDKVISEHFINNRKTHSQNLMPMVKEVLEEGGITPKDLDGIAVSMGPGSFTGLRIGMATAKTLGQVLNKPVIGVPTLDALANNLFGVSGIICPILDAKKNQVYSAFYQMEEGKLGLQTEYMAIGVEEVCAKIRTQVSLNGGKVTFLGDGVPVFKELILQELGDVAQFANDINSLPRGASIAQLGHAYLAQGKTDSYISLQPLYIRQSEAELNWEKKNQK